MKIGGRNVSISIDGGRIVKTVLKLVAILLFIVLIVWSMAGPGFYASKAFEDGQTSVSTEQTESTSDT